MIYRLSADNRRAFIGAQVAPVGFGAKIELSIDLRQGDVLRTCHVVTSVGWTAEDPDIPGVQLLAVRLAPANQAEQLAIWDVACQIALQQAPPGGFLTAVPGRDLVEGLG